MTDSPIPAHLHGRTGTYTNLACRCEECKQAMRDYQRRYRQGKRIEGGVTRGKRTEMAHGTTSMYTSGKCRCGECRTAMSAYQKEYYKRKKVDQGELERLRAEVDYLRRQVRKQGALGFTD